MDVDRRVSPEDFARSAGIGTEELRARYGASGLIRCGRAVGSGQLTLRNDLITTAAHVFYNEDGRLRSAYCAFEPIFGFGDPVEIDLSSIKAGSSSPYDEPPTRDWAVAQLKASVRDATPYQLVSKGAEAGSILMLAGGNGSAPNLGTERCSARGVINASEDGISEVAIDCSGGHGGSGAAFIHDANDEKARAISAIYVGYRSTDPERSHPFSLSHYNFGITIEGAFRRALMEAAAGN